MLRTIALLAGLLVATAACALPGSDDPTPVRPVEAVRLIDTPARSHLLSPDGHWVATEGERSAEVCLTPTDRPGRPVCTEGAGGSVGPIAWAPDSRSVVLLPDVHRRFEIGPVVVLGLDGSRTEVAAPAPSGELFGSPTDAVFDGTDHIVYLVPHEEPARLEVRRVGVDGADDELLATVGTEGDAQLVPDPGMLLHDGQLYVSLSLGDEERGVWRFDLDSGEREPLVVGRAATDEDGDFTGERVVAVRDGHVLTVDLVPLATDIGDGDHFQLRSGDGVLTTVVDRDGFDGVAATLSPDGSQIAVASFPTDRTIEAMRVSVATVESVLAGEPAWHDLDDVAGRLFPELGSGVPKLTWTDDDRLVIGTTGHGIVSVELGPVE